jgi:hypothetical protein
MRKWEISPSDREIFEFSHSLFRRNDRLDQRFSNEIPADRDNERELRRAGIQSPAYFLLRPDGHIGLAGVEAASRRIERYFTDCLGIGGANLAGSMRANDRAGVTGRGSR